MKSNMSLVGFVKEVISIFISGIAFPGFNFQESPGLYPIGKPTKDSPILVTSNYFVTVRRVISSLTKQTLNVWLLIVNTEGVNVWCSAAGGNFTAERILEQIQESQLKEKVSHNNLILPQLSAPGVNHSILKENGWNARFGPIKITDLGNYLDIGQRKTDDSRTIRFPLLERIECSIGHNFFIILILLPFVLLVELLKNPLPFLSPWAQWLVSNLFFLFFYIWGFGFLISILYPFIPFQSGFIKGAILSIIIVPVLSFFLFSTSVLEFILAIGTLFLYSTAISTDFDGFTPLHGMDFFEKDLLLFAITAATIIICMIFIPPIV